MTDSTKGYLIRYHYWHKVGKITGHTRIEVFINQPTFNIYSENLK